jgi:hypothetical protein
MRAPIPPLGWIVVAWLAICGGFVVVAALLILSA